jgi:hypothetical protein
LAIDSRTEQKECQGKVVGTRNVTAEMHTLQKFFMLNVHYQYRLYCSVTTTKTVDREFNSKEVIKINRQKPTKYYTG